MKYYMELTLLDNSDFSCSELWTKLFQQLHLTFVQKKDFQEMISYGLSFPKYRVNETKKIAYLGDKLRIFAESIDALELLNINNRLMDWIDYVHISTFKEVPQDQVIGYAHYYRFKPSLSLDERILKQAKRRNISFEESKLHFKDFSMSSDCVPYINLKSFSNGQSFRLYIAKLKVDNVKNGKYSVYGLSRMATVPEF